MRFYDIALFLFIFNIALGFLSGALSQYTTNTIGTASDGNFSASTSKSMSESVTAQIPPTSSTAFSGLNWFLETVRLTIQSAIEFVSFFFQATILFPMMWSKMISSFGVDVAIGSTMFNFIAMLSAGVYLIYGMAIMQWISGRQLRGMQ